MNKFNLEDYELVETRLARFHEDYPTARVITNMVQYTDERVVFKADLYKAYEDEKPSSTGYAEETRGEGYVNKTSHLENCETSAIGRALANAGYAPMGARPSREEMQKVVKGQNGQEKPKGGNGDKATEKQVAALEAVRGALNWPSGKLSKLIESAYGVRDPNKLTKKQASQMIGKLKEMLQD